MISSTATSVQVDAQGIIQEGHVMEGDLLAIHRGAVGAAPGPLVALNMGKVIIET